MVQGVLGFCVGAGRFRGRRLFSGSLFSGRVDAYLFGRFPHLVGYFPEIFPGGFTGFFQVVPQAFEGFSQARLGVDLLFDLLGSFLQVIRSPGNAAQDARQLVLTEKEHTYQDDHQKFSAAYVQK